MTLFRVMAVDDEVIDWPRGEVRIVTDDSIYHVRDLGLDFVDGFFTSHFAIDPVLEEAHE